VSQTIDVTAYDAYDKNLTITSYDIHGIVNK